MFGSKIYSEIFLKIYNEITTNLQFDRIFQLTSWPKNLKFFKSGPKIITIKLFTILSKQTYLKKEVIQLNHLNLLKL